MATPIDYINRFFRFCWRNLYWAMIGMVLLINIKLHTGPDLSDPVSVVADVRDQMRYLEPQVHQGELGNRMQGIFPEGHVFTHVLYGLTWCELALQPATANDPAIQAKALAEARWAFKQIDSERGQAAFDTGMLPPFGMFYQGWRNYLLAKIVQVSHGENAAEVKYFGTLSQGVASCFALSLSPYPDSYPDQSWPADACVGMASLGLYGRLVGPEFDSLRLRWVNRVMRENKAGRAGLPHKTQAASSAVEEPHRGCSGALNLYFLPDIDTSLARCQFANFRSHFALSRLGLAVTAEYADGGGLGDVDSGPVIWGVGFSGTIVSIGTYLKYGETAQAQAISDAVEALGFSHNFGGKHYIWGSLPIADLFIAWARVQQPDPHVTGSLATTGDHLGSKAVFHCVSLGLVLIVLLLRFGRTLWRRLSQRLRNRPSISSPH